MERKEHFELHLTCSGNGRTIRSLVEMRPGWSYSSIIGDPVLGPGTKSYANSHAPTKIFPGKTSGFKAAKLALKEMRLYLQDAGISVIREKIEKVWYDNVL